MTYDAREISQYGGQPVFCFRFTHNAVTYRWTSADQAISIAVGTFDPAPISCGDFNLGEGGDSGLQEITVRRDNPIAAMMVGYRPVQPVRVEIYAVHRGEAQTILAWKGEVVSHRTAGAQSVLSCAPLLYRLRRKVPAFTFQSQCNHALYRSGCDVVPGTFRVTGVVSTVTADQIEVGAAASKPDGWFNNGYVERSDGSRRFILQHIGDTLTLHWPFADLVSGETVDVYAGCQRTEAICLSKFNNVVNHLGFPRIPTQNPYDGGLV